MKIKRWIEALAELPEEQGKGYGRALFRLAQNLLWSMEDVTCLKMMVMDANRHAYDMYLAHGFEVESIGSHWFVKVVQ